MSDADLLKRSAVAAGKLRLATTDLLVAAFDVGEGRAPESAVVAAARRYASARTTSESLAREAVGCKPINPDVDPDPNGLGPINERITPDGETHE